MNIYYVVCSKAGTNPLNDGRSKTESCGGIKASWLFLLLVLAILFPNTSKFNLSSLILSFWYHINGVILVYLLKQIILFCFETSVKVFEDPPTWLSNHLNCLIWWDGFPLRPVYIQSLINISRTKASSWISSHSRHFLRRSIHLMIYSFELLDLVGGLLFVACVYLVW